MILSGSAGFPGGPWWPARIFLFGVRVNGFGVANASHDAPLIRLTHDGFAALLFALRAERAVALACATSTGATCRLE